MKPCFLRALVSTGLGAMLVGAFLAVLVIEFFWPMANAARLQRVPAKDWFEVKNFEVESKSHVGEPVIVHFDRKVHQPFFGKAVVTLRYVKENGDLDFICSRSNERDFKPEGTFPTTAALSRLMESDATPCGPVQAGWYLLTYCLEIKAESYPPKYSCHDSNRFEVLDRIRPERS